MQGENEITVRMIIILDARFRFIGSLLTGLLETFSQDRVSSRNQVSYGDWVSGGGSGIGAWCITKGAAKPQPSFVVGRAIPSAPL